MKHYIFFIFCAILALLFCPSCIREEEPDNTPVNNFETLWRIIDTQYCFHDYKAQEGCLPWNEVYAKYRPRVHDGMTSAQLFEVLCDMLSELRDGHVNLYSAADVGRYWSWHEDYPSNFNDSIHQVYLGTDYRIAAGMYYKILDDNIGYIYYGSFSSGIGEGNLDEVMYYLRLCNGLIVDVRNNSGGTLTYAERLAERFTNEKRLVGYIAHKTGTGHNDFSSPEAEYIEPSKGIRWQKKAVVLTNRSCYRRPHRRRFRSPLFFRTPQRMVCPLLRLSDVRCRNEPNRVRYQTGHLRIAHTRRPGTQQRYDDRSRPRISETIIWPSR